MQNNRSTGKHATKRPSVKNKPRTAPPALRQQVRTGQPSVRARMDEARSNAATGVEVDSNRPRTYKAPASIQRSSGMPRWMPLALVLVVAVGAWLAFARQPAQSVPEQNTSASTSQPATGQDVAATASSQLATQQDDAAASPSQPAPEQGAPAASQDQPVLAYAAQAISQRAHSGPAGDWSVSFVSTGDMIFGRQVGDYIDMYGGQAVLERVASQLSAADVAIGNLEAPMSDDESEGKWEKDVIILGRPAGIDALTSAGLDLVSLANNHCMDYGASALADTLAALDGAGIGHAGAGMNYDQAWQLAEVTVDGVRIAFLSFTDIIPENFLAYDDGAGVAGARIDMDATCQAVRAASQAYDIVVVAMHWGIEYEDYIDDDLQRTPAHQLVDAGADVILGNHPHVIQGLEFYNGALISYSQGDFVFDHFSSRKTGETFLLDFDMTREGVQNVRATPVYLEDPYGIPYVLEGQEAADVLDRLEVISDGMNTSFTREGDIDHIAPAA